MKNFTLLLCLSIVFGCGSARRVNISEGSKSTDSSIKGPDGLKVKILEPTKELGKSEFSVKAANIQPMMEAMASDKLQGREAGSEGIEEAAKQIIYHFKENGIPPFFESYQDTLLNFRKAAYNIVGVIEGNDPILKSEFILIGAHYDHIGNVKPENGDYIANGANDNASGTVTVMELARYFANDRTNKRSLIFALFSAEEKGLLGSEHLAKKLKVQNTNLYLMLNFEMTGVPLQGKDYFMYITGFHKSNLAEVGNKYGGVNMIGYLPTAKEYNLFQRSDNYPFYQEFKIPSHTFCTFDFTNFDYYHKPGDEVEEMDFEHMAALVNKSIPIIEGIANAPTQEVKMK